MFSVRRMTKDLLHSVVSFANRENSSLPPFAEVFLKILKCFYWRYQTVYNEIVYSSVKPIHSTFISLHIWHGRQTLVPILGEKNLNEEMIRILKSVAFVVVRMRHIFEQGAHLRYYWQLGYRGMTNSHFKTVCQAFSNGAHNKTWVLQRMSL